MRRWIIILSWFKLSNFVQKLESVVWYLTHLTFIICITPSPSKKSCMLSLSIVTPNLTSRLRRRRATPTLSPCRIGLHMSGPRRARIGRNMGGIRAYITPLARCLPGVCFLSDSMYGNPVRPLLYAEVVTDFTQIYSFER